MTGRRITNRLGALLDLYAKTARNSVAAEFQYRLAHFMRLLGFMIEPVVYLAVWTAVLRAGGGTVGGYDIRTLSGYYIVWMLVRTMNLVFTPYGFESRIRNGDFSAKLLQPVHPIHADLADFAGAKVIQILMWFPMAAVLTLVFRPALNPGPLQVLVFVVAAVAAYVLRSLMLWLLGLVTFWTTRVAALFETFMATELLLSGRLVPMSFLPDWAQRLAGVLPFKWTFGFPIESVATDLRPAALLGGVAMQLAWIGCFAALVALVWRRAVRRYCAVGG